MAVIISYDDSDGWYDHVVPPIVSPSNTTADALAGPSNCGTPAIPLAEQQFVVDFINRLQALPEWRERVGAGGEELPSGRSNAETLSTQGNILLAHKVLGESDG